MDDPPSLVLALFLALLKVGLAPLFIPTIALFEGWFIAGTGFVRRGAKTLLWAFLFNCSFAVILMVIWPREMVPWPFALVFLVALVHAYWLHRIAVSMAGRKPLAQVR